MASPETVLITGASSGIGRELAHQFARAGSDCVLLARSADDLRTVADTLESEYDVEALVLPADLSEREAPEEVVSELDEMDRTVDVLVNNAGLGARGSFSELDVELQMNMIRVNVSALTHLSRLLLPGMLERNRKGSGILNVASTAAFQAGPKMSVYYATKAYVLSFSEGLTEEVADSNLTVTCLAPGPTRTAFVNEAEVDGTTLLNILPSMTAETVARAGYNAFRNSESLAVPGWQNKIGAFLTRFTPRPVLRKTTAWLHSSA